MTLLKIIISLLLIAQSGFSIPNDHIEEVERGVLDIRYPSIFLLLNNKNLKCVEDKTSPLKNPVKYLRLYIPELDTLASLKHRAHGDTSPSLSPGACGTSFNESFFLDSQESKKTTIYVMHREVFQLNHTKRTCSRTLREIVALSLKGTVFQSQNSLRLSETTYDVCLQMLKTL